MARLSMRGHWAALAVVCAAAWALRVAQTAPLSLADAFAKIDQEASHFKSLSANVTYLSHTDVISEDDVQSGVILVKRPHIKISIDKPAAKIAVTDGKEAMLFYPSTMEKQKLDLGRGRRSLFDQILLLGFGGTSQELQRAYDVSLGGPDTVAGESTTRLVLIPKSQDMRDQWIKIELWISDQAGYAVQQKFYEHGKDYTLVTYTNVKLNPDIPDSELKLETPKGTKTEPLFKK